MLCITNLHVILLCVALYDALSLLLLYLSNHYVENIIINYVLYLVVLDIWMGKNTMITHICAVVLCMTKYRKFTNSIEKVYYMLDEIFE